ncbi:MAG: glutaredoxin family protein [Elainellaceae cyanobacterium]
MQHRTVLSIGLNLVAIAMLAIATGCSSNQASSPGENLASSSSQADVTPELALANHLTENDAKMYGAFWCPHCADQKAMFGDAVQALTYVECDPEGENPQPELCQEVGIEGYPTWEVDGQLYPGVRSLEELADLSNYEGPTDFTSSQAPSE